MPQSPNRPKPTTQPPRVHDSRSAVADGKSGNETLSTDTGRGRIEQLIGALTVSLEDKAGALFSTLARAAFEGTHQPDARHTCQAGELRNMARLTRAASRMREARTRLRATCSKPKNGEI